MHTLEVSVWQYGWKNIFGNHITPLLVEHEALTAFGRKWGLHLFWKRSSLMITEKVFCCIRGMFCAPFSHGFTHRFRYPVGLLYFFMTIQPVCFQNLEASFCWRAEPIWVCNISLIILPLNSLSGKLIFFCIVQIHCIGGSWFLFFSLQVDTTIFASSFDIRSAAKYSLLLFAVSPHFIRKAKMPSFFPTSLATYPFL